MTLTVLLAVLAAALLHAGWNAAIKTGANKQTGMFILSVGHAAIGLVLTLGRGVYPSGEVWPWLIASAVIHMGYQMFLSFAYDSGDLSRVYPLSRGTAPMAVLLVTAVLGIDTMTVTEVLGCLVLGLGILTMARGVFSSGESRKMLPYAFGAACATAGYTLVDGLGARVAGDPVAFVGWLMVGSALAYTPAIIALRGVGVMRAEPKVWGLGLVAAAASFGAYAIAVWAMTVAPLALVAAIRETSILFAVLIGWLVFGERMDRGKALAAGLIVAGVVLTRV
jgi:drug/metabolite transporter (DMT)-like permease